MSDELQVEASGETVGEAKWQALRELERLDPDLDKAAVRFQVVTEGERGLLGVGYAPARVVASVDTNASTPEPVDESDTAARVRELLERFAATLGFQCRVDIEETGDAIVASCTGRDLGLLIGKHGQTIDALQYLANAMAHRDRTAEYKPIVVDAGGYRARREATLDALAMRSAERALQADGPVELEPMTSVERKVVHLRLKDVPGVETTSEGTEPNRFVVVRPPVAPDVLERWLAAVVATPGLTAADDLEVARRTLLDDALRAVEVVRDLEGPVVDVGSGGGTPGIPLAASLPGREVTLLEPLLRKAEFLELWARELPNLSVVRGRAEEQETDTFGVAVAKALAPPPVALEWCLPLVRLGGAAVLFVGPSADLDAVARASRLLAGGPPTLRDGLLLVPKLGPTPEGFPRKPGIARKRPLA